MEWLQLEIFNGLSLLDCIVLTLAGLFAGSMNYLLTEKLKLKVPSQFRGGASFLIAILLTTLGLPLLLDNLGSHDIRGWHLIAAITLCSIANWLFAKAAHDYFMDLVSAAKARVIDMIGGGGA